MKQKLLATLETAQNYTMNVAELMPEEAYGFRPAEGVWTFAELMNHIGYGIYWWEDNYIREKKTAWEPSPVTVGKRATVHYLGDAFAALRKTVMETADGDPLAAGVWATLDHVTHHRGQATIYLRCQGIVPPEYVW
jgi:uncharacterized damage-inducible protein DinB